MRKNGFTIIEVIAVFLLILGVTFFILPMSLDNTKQARLISKWTEVYSEMEYMFSVIKAQTDGYLEEQFKRAPDNKGRTELLLGVVRPYLRIKSGVATSDYSQSYMNKTPVRENDRYYFDNFYYTSSDQIVGLKWFTKNCKDETVCGVIAMDVNGITPPNTWGKDVFGINILKSSIEPIGKNMDQDVLKNDCSAYGNGIYCSYYYLIGGKFD